MGIFGNLKKGLIFVVSAPSGAGKTTLVEKLIAEYPSALKRSVSCTTRERRGSEKSDIDYIFLTKEAFEEKIKQGAFLEHTKVFNYYYGTLKKTVDQVINQGQHVFLVIDTEGALKVKKLIQAVFIFIKPPTLQVLRERLEKRHTDDSNAIALRLSYAESEMSQANHYDYTIINDDLEEAYAALKSCVEQEEKKSCDYL